MFDVHRGTLNHQFLCQSSPQKAQDIINHKGKLHEINTPVDRCQSRWGISKPMQVDYKHGTACNLGEVWAISIYAVNPWGGSAWIICYRQHDGWASEQSMVTVQHHWMESHWGQKLWEVLKAYWVQWLGKEQVRPPVHDSEIGTQPRIKGLFQIVQIPTDIANHLIFGAGQRQHQVCCQHEITHLQAGGSMDASQSTKHATVTNPENGSPKFWLTSSSHWTSVIDSLPLMLTPGGLDWAVKGGGKGWGVCFLRSSSGVYVLAAVICCSLRRIRKIKINQEEPDARACTASDWKPL